MDHDDKVVSLNAPVDLAVPAPMQGDTPKDAEAVEISAASDEGKLPVGAIAKKLASQAPIAADSLAAPKEVVESPPVAASLQIAPMPEIKVPTRDTVVLRSERPRGRKLRLMAGACAVLFAGWLTGLNTQTTDLSTPRTWMHQSASVLSSAYWLVEKELKDRFEQWTRSGAPTEVASQVASPEHVNHTDALERSVEGLKIKLGQMQLSSEGLTEDLRTEVEGYRSSVERTQAELTSKLSQVLERLERIEQQRSSSPVAAGAQKPEQVATLSPAVPPSAPAQRSAPAPDVKPTPSSAAPEPRRELTVIKQWTVREVLNGMALLEGPRGLVGVSPGQTVPGVGRVESIIRQGGRWVVATSSGVITGR